MNKNDWDDIKYVLAIADEGSLNAAAKKLGVTHATVLRRVRSFEDRCQRPIFRKSRTGYTVLPEAAPVLQAARNVEDAVLTVDRTLQGTDDTLAGSVRIASTDSICQVLLPPIVEKISAANPDLSICLLSANSYHDLSRLAADIAVRPSVDLEEELNGQAAGFLKFGVFATDVETNRWIGLQGNLLRSKPAAWISEHVPRNHIFHEADSFLVMKELIAAGLGKGFLPLFLGEGDPRFSRVEMDLPVLSVPVWIAIQKQVLGNAKFRLVRDLISAELEAVL